VFNLFQYAAVAKAILKDGPTISTALEKYDKGLDKMHAANASRPAPANEKARLKFEMDQEAVANKIVRNRAKLQHARRELEEEIEAVQRAARKISNVHHWA